MPADLQKYGPGIQLIPGLLFVFSPPVVRLAAKLIRFEGSYLRFEGSATIEKLEQGRAVESVTEDSAVWELMYFGKAGADKK